MICSGCLRDLCRPLICCYLQGKVNAVDYLPTLFGDNHLCVFLAVYTLATLVLWSPWDQLKGWAGVCMLVFVWKFGQREKQAARCVPVFQVMQVCNIQRTCHILEFFFFSQLWPTFTHNHLNTHKVTLPVVSHTHTCASCSRCWQTAQRWQLLPVVSNTSVNEVFRPAVIKLEGLNAAQSHRVEMEEGWSLPPRKETRKRERG